MPNKQLLSKIINNSPKLASLYVHICIISVHDSYYTSTRVYLGTIPKSGIAES